MESPLDHLQGDVRVPLGEDPSHHFVLNYQQRHDWVIKEKNPDWRYKIRGHADREIDVNIEVKKKIRAEIEEETKTWGDTSQQLVSYWRGKLPDGDPWIAALLVDRLPDKKDVYVKRQPKKELKFGVPDLSKPPPALSNLVAGIPIVKIKGTQKPRVGSMLDDILAPDRGNQANSPLGATQLCRRLVLGRAMAIINQMTSETLTIQYTSAAGIQDLAEFNFDTFERDAWTTDWNKSIFTRLWAHLENVQRARFALQQNIRLIRRLIPRDHDTIGKEVPYEEYNDLAEWEDLEARLESLAEAMKRSRSNYLQTVQASEAQFANLQARSVGNLTKLATIFVPLSLSAAILTIPGFDGDGNKRTLWIFWTACVPLVIILALLLYTGLGVVVQEYWGKRQRERRERRDRARRYMENLPKPKVKPLETLTRGESSQGEMEMV